VSNKSGILEKLELLLKNQHEKIQTELSGGKENGIYTHRLDRNDHAN
jgi:hypothetical protein